jgi:hypothetical protein
MPRISKAILLTILFACVSGFAFLVALQEDRDINTEIVIDAPLKAVWKVLGDTQRYAEWNPLILDIAGNVQAGSKIQVTLKVPGSSPSSYAAKLIGYVPDHELRWEHDAAIPKLYSGKHKLIIEALGESQVRFRHEEELRGLLVGPLTSDYLDKKLTGFERMNDALKKRVEAQHSQR